MKHNKHLLTAGVLALLIVLVLGGTFLMTWLGSNHPVILVGLFIVSAIFIFYKMLYWFMWGEY